MNSKELVKLFWAFGCTVKVTSTGDTRYKRGFIISADGCTIGRTTIFNEVVSHIKWYWKEYKGSELNSSDVTMSQWRYFLNTGKIMSPSDFWNMVNLAKTRQEMDYICRYGARQKLVALDAKPKKRKGIIKRDIRKFFDLGAPIEAFSNQSEPYVKPEVRSQRTGLLVCPCGKGYASEHKEGSHYGICNPCYRSSLSRADLTKLGLKRP